MLGKEVNKEEDGTEPIGLVRHGKEWTAAVKPSDAGVAAEKRVEIRIQRSGGEHGRGAVEAQVV